MATLNPALRDFWTTPARNKVLYGGRASSKSWDAAGTALWLAQATKKKIMCVRQLQNRIEDSVYTLLKNRISDFGFDGLFEVKRNTIECPAHGSSFVFYGLWRNLEEIKSAEGIDILWIEEAHNLTEDQWDILEPTIRAEGSQVWVIFNPKYATDFAYKRFVLDPPPDTVVRKINYDENPFLSETMLRIIRAKKDQDEDAYNHIYRGETLQDSDKVIIKRSWVRAAIDAHIRLDIDRSGVRQVGFDIADDGDDECATIYREGIVAVHSDEWRAKEDELFKSAARVHAYACGKDAGVNYDSIGVGASAGAHFNMLNKDAESAGVIRYGKYNAAGAVVDPARRWDKNDPNSEKNKDKFSNRKAQDWWRLRTLFLNTFNAVNKGMVYPDDELISLSSDMPNLDKLIDELCSPHMDTDGRGKTKVESKVDMKKRGISSPNLADALIMAFSPIEGSKSNHMGFIV